MSANESMEGKAAMAGALQIEVNPPPLKKGGKKYGRTAIVARLDHDGFSVDITGAIGEGPATHTHTIHVREQFPQLEEALRVIAEAYEPNLREELGAEQKSQAKEGE